MSKCQVRAYGRPAAHPARYYCCYTATDELHCQAKLKYRGSSCDNVLCENGRTVTTQTNYVQKTRTWSCLRHQFNLDSIINTKPSPIQLRDPRPKSLANVKRSTPVRPWSRAIMAPMVTDCHGSPVAPAPGSPVAPVTGYPVDPHPDRSHGPPSRGLPRASCTGVPRVHPSPAPTSPPVRGSPSAFGSGLPRPPSSQAHACTPRLGLTRGYP